MCWQENRGGKGCIEEKSLETPCGPAQIKGNDRNEKLRDWELRVIEIGRRHE